MNKLLLGLFFTLYSIASIAQESVSPDTIWQVKGRVLDKENGLPVPNASIMFFDNGYKGGTIADSLGCFKLSLKQGRYAYRTSCMGYKQKDLGIAVAGDSDIGNIYLEIESIKLREAVVKHKLIERKSDRIIMNMIGNPWTTGQNAFSMLYHIPGVWGLSIYGRPPARVFINGRELRMEPSEVMNYLGGLSADDILQYEVIPYAGARFDGNTVGGIIRITLRKVMKGGIKGSAKVSMSSNVENSLSIDPSFSLFAQKGKFYTYTYLNSSNLILSEEERASELIYLNRNASISDQYTTQHSIATLSLDQSVVCNLSDKQTLGAAFYMFIKPNEKFKEKGSTLSYGLPNELYPTLDSNYQIAKKRRTKTEVYNYNTSLDYSLQLDSLNSNFRIVADYLTRRDQEHLNLNERYESADMGIDVLSRDKHLVDKNTFQTYFDWNWDINPKTSFEAGAKFFGLWANGNVVYEDWKEGMWEKNHNTSNLYKYHEYISAGYVNFSSSVGEKWMYSLGLRVENTQTVFKSLKVDESNTLRYTSLFPAANIAYQVNEDKGHFLALNYNRTISRPIYSDLDPGSYKTSENVYTKGNSTLKPSFENSLAANLTLFSNYSVNLSAEWANDVYNEVLSSFSGDTVYLESQNYGDVVRGRCYVSSRHKFIKWWDVNFNLGLTVQRENTQDWGNVRSTGLNFSWGNSIRLPRNWSLSCSASYQYPLKEAGRSVNQTCSVYAGVYKWLTKRVVMTFSAGTGNILGRYKSEQINTNFKYRSELLSTFRSFSIGISYKFEKGKEVKEKQVRIDSEAKERSGK